MVHKKKNTVVLAMHGIIETKAETTNGD